MSKRLILMRHAKSDWKSPAQGDHERPLNARGRGAAKALGHWLGAEKYLPDQALVSSATRTRETFDGLDLACPVRFLPELYHADPEEMLRILRTAGEGVILMLGHNPGTGALAEALLRQAPDHERFFDYPTGASLIADFAIDDWRGLKPGMGRAVAFVIPTDLPVQSCNSVRNEGPFRT